MLWVCLLEIVCTIGLCVVCIQNARDWAKSIFFSGSSSCCLLQLALGVQDIEQIVRETCMNMMTDRIIGILHHVACSVLPRFTLLKLLVSPHIHTTSASSVCHNHYHITSAPGYQSTIWKMSDQVFQSKPHRCWVKHKYLLFVWKLHINVGWHDVFWRARVLRPSYTWWQH